MHSIGAEVASNGRSASEDMRLSVPILTCQF